MILGRTNTEFPSTWLKLAVSRDCSPAELAAAARATGVPLDISSQPALWGGSLRGGEDVLMVESNFQVERGTSQDHSTDLLQANLIEHLSSIGREMVDIFVFRVRRVMEDHQIAGAMAALEFAKSEGHVRYLCLGFDGPVPAVMSFWQFHDAFELVRLPATEGYSAALDFAHNRRVGVIVSGVTDRPDAVSLKTVSTLEDIRGSL
ncbi:MAG TPA: hypothetical protein VK171_13970, partial [Fimbriimonas sp.]|nr:hypothetical protein [Fimbriimonas sp.]